MIIDFALLSEAGPRRDNQDSVVAMPDGNGDFLFAVADGLGGHKGGSHASQLAISLLVEFWEQKPLDEILLTIHNNLKAEQKANDDLLGMATTATALVVKNGYAQGAHCGDTRCSILRGNGIRRLTVEHTEAQRLYDGGKLTKEEFLHYPRRNILDQALGGDRTPKIDTFGIDLMEKDKIIISSDGVHEKIKQREILQLVQSIEKPGEVVDVIGSKIREKEPDDNYSLVCAIVKLL